MALYSRRRVARPPQESAISPWPFAGMGLMAAAFFLYAVSGLVAPRWAVVVLLLVWAALLALCCVWWTPHPRRLVGVAAFAIVVWFCTLVAGGAWLGWSG